MKYKLLYTGDNQVIAEAVALDYIKLFRIAMIEAHEAYIENVADKLVIIKDNQEAKDL